jgi:hypothetical protein
MKKIVMSEAFMKTAKYLILILIQGALFAQDDLSVYYSKEHGFMITPPDVNTQEYKHAVGIVMKKSDEFRPNINVLVQEINESFDDYYNLSIPEIENLGGKLIKKSKTNNIYEMEYTMPLDDNSKLHVFTRGVNVSNMVYLATATCKDSQWADVCVNLIDSLRSLRTGSGSVKLITKSSPSLYNCEQYQFSILSPLPNLVGQKQQDGSIEGICFNIGSNLLFDSPGVLVTINKDAESFLTSYNNDISRYSNNGSQILMTKYTGKYYEVERIADDKTHKYEIVHKHNDLKISIIASSRDSELNKYCERLMKSVNSFRYCN